MQGRALQLLRLPCRESQRSQFRVRRAVGARGVHCLDDQRSGLIDQERAERMVPIIARELRELDRAAQPGEIFGTQARPALPSMERPMALWGSTRAARPRPGIAPCSTTMGPWIP